MTRRINYQWLTWGVSSVFKGGLPDDVSVRMDVDRGRAEALRVLTRTIPIPWVEDRSLSARFIDHSRRLRREWRRSAEMVFGVHDVYLEFIGGTGAAPTFRFTDLRICLDDQVVGRAWTVGCSLGFGASRSPAVAMLRDDLALRVDVDARNLELLALREPGSKKKAFLAARGGLGRESSTSNGL